MIWLRIGGDEFLLFMHYNTNLEHAIKRIYASLTGEYDGFSLSVSMGIAKTPTVGRDYQALYHCADLALFDAKRKGQGCYTFYDEKSCPQNVHLPFYRLILHAKNKGGLFYDFGRIVSGNRRQLS